MQEAKPLAPEQAAEYAPSIIERAHEIGRGVLRLLHTVRQDVVAADTQERVPTPTDIQPLDEADAHMRAAIEALTAPIDAYAAQHTPQETTPVAAETQVTQAEAPEDRASRHQHLGFFAVGAATVGVLVYNWRRQHENRREQRRFERRIKVNRGSEREQMQRFEQISIATLSQAERQQHVHEVSQFANEQTEIVRAAARYRDNRQPEQAPLPPPAEFMPPAWQPELAPEIGQPALAASESSEIRQPQASERIREVRTAFQDRLAASSLAQNLSGWKKTISTLITGQAPDGSSYRRGMSASLSDGSGQGWVFGFSLAIGMVGVVLVLMNFL